MKIVMIFIGSIFLLSLNTYAEIPAPPGDETTYGTNDTWIGYVYDNSDFTSYQGYVNEGTPGNPNFDQSFGGDQVNYIINGNPTYTETFSVRYKLRKTFAPGSYQFAVGADDGYRLSIDGGATWIINRWVDQGYNFVTADATLNGTYDLIIEFYENAGGNRVSFNVQPLCTGSEDQTIYGTGNIWKGYIYDGVNFNTYKGMVTAGNPASLNFDEGYGGDNVTYTTSSCSTPTETFSARYRLRKTFASGIYLFTVGADDGFRLSFDGGATWAINQWWDESYAIASTSISLNGTYDLVLEYYENGGQNRLSMDMSITTLPVQLKKFTVTAVNKTAVLNWITAVETNVSHYQVERSANGIDFTTIQTISAGIGQGDKTYRWTDPAPLPGNNYYRLKMVDNNLIYRYSAVMRINFQTLAAPDIYPTLTHNHEVQLKTAIDIRELAVTLYSMTGQKMQEIKIPVVLNAGEAIPLRLNSNLAKGMYLLVCTSGNSIVKKQPVIIE